MESLGTGAREGVRTFKVIKKKPGEGNFFLPGS